MTSLYAGVSRCLTKDIATAEAGEHAAVFRFPESFIGFSGHFPENPVLPGIAQIMAVQVTAASAGATAHLVRVKRCKFLRPVRPNEPMQVGVFLSRQEGLHAAMAQLSVTGEPCAAMSLLLDIRHDNKNV